MIVIAIEYMVQIIYNPLAKQTFTLVIIVITATTETDATEKALVLPQSLFDCDTII